MSWAPGPVVTRRRLGGELRRLRLEADRTLEDVAEALHCSTSKLSRLETGKGIPKARDVRDLLDVFGVADAAERERLLQWASTGQQPVRWRDEVDLLPAKTAAYIELEWDAERIRAFEAHVPHGLLQTEDYARAVLAAAWGGEKDATAIERFVDVRMRRQEALDPRHGLALECVVDESALYRVVGSVETLRGQLRHLTEVVESRRAELRVLPFSAGLVVSANQGSFATLEFGDTLREGLVYVETPDLESDVRSDPADVARFTQRFASLRAASLDPEESMLRIAQAHRRTT